MSNLRSTTKVVNRRNERGGELFQSSFRGILVSPGYEPWAGICQRLRRFALVANSSVVHVRSRVVHVHSGVVHLRTDVVHVHSSVVHVWQLEFAGRG